MLMEHRHTRSHFNRHGAPKREFTLQVEAERWALLLHTVGITEILLEAYQCGICHDWHLGNPR